MEKKANIIDGKMMANKLLSGLKKRIDQDRSENLGVAKLTIVLVGDYPASNIYVENKMQAAELVGINTQLEKFSEDISEQELLARISDLNSNDSISGIIVQLPLPSAIKRSQIIRSINPEKDVDGFHPINLGLLFSPYEHGFVPCTALGCLELIKSVCPDLVGKKAVVIGRSNIVGRPLAALLLKEHCSVTICHSHTVNLESITQQADIIISAVGRAKFLTPNYFNKNSIVIDVGINREKLNSGYALCGDVDFQSVQPVVKHITPVPGGVGPMTVAYLLINSYIAKFGMNHYKNR